MTEKKRVLVVEDDNIWRETLVDILGREEYSVDQAADGLDALEIYEKCMSDYYAIVTDMRMPRMNGAEFAKEVRRRGYTGRIVVSTATPQDLTMELRSYFDNVLCKPYRMKDLIAALE